MDVLKKTPTLVLVFPYVRRTAAIRRLTMKLNVLVAEDAFSADKSLSTNTVKRA